MEGLARIAQDQGRHSEAERLWRETLDLRIAALGKEHPDTLLSMTYLAGVLDTECRYEEAEQLYRKALAIQRRVVGPHHPETRLYGVQPCLQRGIARPKGWRHRLSRASH